MERRFALIIANSEYDEAKGFTPLKAPIEDARQMAELLADPNIGDFQVEPPLINADRILVESTLEKFFCENRQPDDLLLFYFSGHGLKHLPLGSKLFFAVNNSNRSSPISSAISASIINDMMKSSPARKQIIILDCCYSGAFSREFQKKGNSIVNISDHFDEGRGKFILAASGAIEESFEYDRPEKTLSVFTEALIDGLRTGAADVDHDGEISFEDLWSYVEIEVPRRKPGQNPQHQAMEAHKKLIVAHNPVSKLRLPLDIESMLESNDADVRQLAFRKLVTLSQGDGKFAIAARGILEILRDTNDPIFRISQQDIFGLDAHDMAHPQRNNPAHQTGNPLILALGQDIKMELVDVPTGEFWMGGDQNFDDEKPKHNVNLVGYWMGKHPVTNAQYRVFTRETQHAEPGGGFPAFRDDHPVVNVSWRDAMDFARWLDQKFKSRLEEGMCFRLPTEAEWEKAARGMDGRLYPWGNGKPSADLCNFTGSKIGSTTPVGKYSPRGDSPFGCADMAGNVWEWTHSLYTPYPYRAGDGREDEGNMDRRVLRGGSFGRNAGPLRCSHRGFFNPGSISPYYGFRVCMGPILN